MSLHSVSSFQEEWYTNKKYKLWISKSSKSAGARCTLCKKDIDISIMGSSALDSHAKGKKHLDRVEKRSMGLDIFFKKTSPSSNCLASRSTSQSTLQSTSQPTSQ